MNITLHKAQEFKANEHGEYVSVTTYDVEANGETVGFVENVFAAKWSATRFDDSDDLHFVGLFDSQDEAVAAIIENV